MDKDLEKVSSNIQQAHRYCVAFYRRFLPLLMNAARQSGFEFSHWRPQTCSRPSRGTRNPAENWAWDFVPLFDVIFLFGKPAERDNGEVRTILEVTFCTEPDWVENEEQNPDPFELSEKETGPPIVELVLFKCNASGGANVTTVWSDLDYPENYDGKYEILPGEHEAKAVAKIVELKDFLSDPAGQLNALTEVSTLE